MYKKRNELTRVVAMNFTMPDDARKLYRAYPATKYVNEFFGMTLGERAHIVRLGKYKKFNPDTEAPSKEFKKKYSEKWYRDNVCCTEEGEILFGDTSTFITNLCLFKERVQPDWKPVPVAPLDFYTQITRETALGWYESCPPHLRHRLESEMSKYPEAEEVPTSHEMYKVVKRLWGDRPAKTFSADENCEIFKSNEEGEVYAEWVREYDKQVAIEAILLLAPALQEERRMLNKAMGLDVDALDLPSQADGLDDTQAATVRWLQASGEMPLEFLARTYRNEDAKMGDRITAARTLMDYAHRKVPVKQEIDTTTKTTPKVDPNMLRGLSESELETLEKLLSKLGDGNG